MRVAWRGVFPAVTTLFHQDQTLDLTATVDHVERLIQHGVHGLIVLGTVGENTALEFQEKLELLNAVVGHVSRRVPVLAGVAESSTRLACRFAEQAQQIGVDGLMVLPALAYQSDSRETIAHFRAVAAATDLPIMCYNNPATYHVDITPPMFVDLAEEPQFVAIKESSENVRRITDLYNLLGDRYIIFCGVDDLVLESVVLGAVGWVAGLANAFPRESCRLWQLAVEGQWDKARQLYRWFTPLLHLDTRTKLVQCIKLAMAERQLGSETVRAPRLPLAGREREEILSIIRRALHQQPPLSDEM